MSRREKAGKRLSNASTVQCKVNRVYFRGLGLLNQVKPETCSQDRIDGVIRIGIAMHDLSDQVSVAMVVTGDTPPEEPMIFIAVNALFVLPEWPDDTPICLTDFNDLACWLASNKRGAVCAS